MPSIELPFPSMEQEFQRAVLRIRITLLRIRILLFTFLRMRIRIPDSTFYTDADPDPDPDPTTHFFPDFGPPMLQNDPFRLPPFYFDADPDPDPAFRFDADSDPDPASQNDADPYGFGRMHIRIRNIARENIVSHDMLPVKLWPFIW
jgi:hypothetical protein